jgi:hypothetical protein
MAPKAQTAMVIENLHARELRPEERRVIAWLFSVPFPGHQELLLQLPFLRVVGEIPCCPTLKLQVSSEAAAPAPVLRHVPVEAEGTDATGSAASILLHVVHGYMEELEVVFWAGGHSRQFPQIQVVVGYLPEEPWWSVRNFPEEPSTPPSVSP